MATVHRRNFLKASGLSLVPAFLPAPIFASAPDPGKSTVRFFFDGPFFDPGEYITQLAQINSASELKRDIYGKGGAVDSLEKKFEQITGKEKAIFMPTGTMANQLAIAVLSEDNTKVFVQENSHVFRDEADAAQSVFNKRLIPLAKGGVFFTAEELQEALDYHNKGEVFESGMGAVSVENPVRRSDGMMVPLDEIRKISAYCRKNSLRLHLDGARIYMASAWSGVSVKEYASYFDTIYISLYKYLGASAGAVLCGDKAVMEKMDHLIKVHGGGMFGNWLNAGMALHRLEGIEIRLKRAKERAEEIFALLNQSPGIKVTSLKGGTNIYDAKFSGNINGKQVADLLSKTHGILINKPNDQNEFKLTVNETLLNKEAKEIARAFADAIKSAKI